MFQSNGYPNTCREKHSSRSGKIIHLNFYYWLFKIVPAPMKLIPLMRASIILVWSGCMTSCSQLSTSTFPRDRIRAEDPPTIILVLNPAGLFFTSLSNPIKPVNTTTMAIFIKISNSPVQLKSDIDKRFQVQYSGFRNKGGFKS